MEGIIINCDKSKDYCKLKIWVSDVISRDGKCLRCGKTHFLQAHHIQKLNKGDAHFFDKECGVTLCKECHEEFHNNVPFYYSRQQTLKFIMGVKDWTKVR